MVNYSPVGDLVVVSICMVMIVLMAFSYVRKTRTYNIFLIVIGLLLAAAISDVAFHQAAGLGTSFSYHAAYALRFIFHGFLYAIFVFFAVYINEVAKTSPGEKRRYIGIAVAIFLLVVAADLIVTVTGRGMRITEAGIESRGFNSFIWGYIAFVILMIVLLYRVRTRVYREVMRGFIGSIMISFFILTLQGIHGQSSFTVATFLYPVIGMFYILHSNPYDVRIGSLDVRAFADEVRLSYERRKEFVFMSLYLREMTEEGRKVPEGVQALIRKYAAETFRGSLLFQASKGHAILMFHKKQNPGYQQTVQDLLSNFGVHYEQFHLDYKIVIGESIDEISKRGEYISLINSTMQGMKQNTIHYMTEDDIKAFEREKIILAELEDIAEKRNLNDPRVLLYCQPVYNIGEGCYDTAEALMRLELDSLGIVYPNEFIPLAEKQGLIHILTEIILHKTCLQIRSLLVGGYRITRVSVNVSALELRDERFCEDIIRIIDDTGIPRDKIAIELTESQTEADFLRMKARIDILRQQGIKFYLDDFGTGYSNMERIIELPFDIIKFDRSLVLACADSKRSRQIVASLATMFTRMKYAVLFEGIEEDEDQQLCTRMHASFLQGYKFSRPVPAQHMVKYLSK